MRRNPMADIKFTFDEFVFDSSVIHNILVDGTKQLQKETEENMDKMISKPGGWGASGKYYKTDPAGSIRKTMKRKISSAKAEGVITFEGVQHLHQKKPVRNAEIAFIVEYGAPRRKGKNGQVGFPARPFMWKTVSEFRSDEIAEKYIDQLIK